MLLLQYFYYCGFHLRDPRPDKDESAENGVPTERTPLVANGHAGHASQQPPNAADIDPTSRTRSQSSFRERFASLDGTFLSPATPMHPQSKDADATEMLKASQPRSWVKAFFFNSTAILLVVAAGVAGYYLSPSTPPEHHRKTPADDQESSLQFSVLGQVFGYICTVFYLASRVPQLLLNYRRK